MFERQYTPGPPLPSPPLPSPPLPTPPTPPLQLFLTWFLRELKAGFVGKNLTSRLLLFLVFQTEAACQRETIIVGW